MLDKFSIVKPESEICESLHDVLF